MRIQNEHPNEKNIAQVELNPHLTTDCITGAIDAYADFSRKPWNPPRGFELFSRFSGWDRYLVHKGEEERFGLIFQLKRDPGTWLVAFRGTSSNLDKYEDLWANTVDFKPFGPTRTFPKNVAVASGFNSIYTEKGGSMKASMQEQLFRGITTANKKLSRIFITGHSLGGALASLFALDVAASRPDITVINTTFASPRVGKSVWQGTYEKKLDLQGVTFRVANYWDFVPSLPPRILGYEHVGQPFLVDFYVKDAILPHPISRHSADNYQVVLRHAVEAKPQVWRGEFPDQTQSKWTMISTTPPSSDVPEWAGILHDFERKARANPDYLQFE